MAKIVFIEDEQELCELYETLLASETLDVLTFKDDLSAIKYFEDNSYDLCFVDYHVGGVLGTEIREKIPRELKCVLITGEHDLKLPEGFSGIVKKPFDFDKFQDMVDHYLSL